MKSCSSAVILAQAAIKNIAIGASTFWGKDGGVVVTELLPPAIVVHNLVCGDCQIFISGYVSKYLAREPVCKPLSGSFDDRHRPQRPFYPVGFVVCIALVFCGSRGAVGKVS